MDEEKVLIVGGDSMLANAFCASTTATLIRTTRRSEFPAGWMYLDLAGDAGRFDPPEGITSCLFFAGQCSIAKCEESPVATRRVNVDNTITILQALLERGIHVTWFSSNLVFDGTVPFVPAETDLSPLTEYGRQKAAVEKWLSSRPGSTVIRLSKVIPPGYNLFDRWLDLWAEGKETSAFNDLRFAPVSTDLIVDTLKLLVEVEVEARPRILQLSANAEISYFDAAQYLLSHFSNRLESSRANPEESTIPSNLKSLLAGHTTMNSLEWTAFTDMSAPSPYSSLENYLIRQGLAS